MPLTHKLISQPLGFKNKMKQLFSSPRSKIKPSKYIGSLGYLLPTIIMNDDWFYVINKVYQFIIKININSSRR